MERQRITIHSVSLGREMNMMIYGTYGLPVLGFPTQNSPCENYEDFGMVDQISDYLNAGRIQLFVPDTVDAESWSDAQGDPERRAERQEQYYHFIVDEVIPLIRERNELELLPLVTGMSMGANHAAIVFLRRPELFRGVLALSGVYDSDYFFHGWMNSVLYESSPERFLPSMPTDHPYIKIYNRKKIIFCVGQGAWEEDGVRTLKHLERVFGEKGINAWCDFWGFDVNHDWPWWFRQMRYHLPRFLEDEG